MIGSPLVIWAKRSIQLRQMLDTLAFAPGGVTGTRPDRLARSTRDPLNTLAAIADRKAGFRSLGDTRADTTVYGRLMLTVLGRKPMLTPHQQREAIRRLDRDGEPVREIGRSYNVSHSTISRLAAST